MKDVSILMIDDHVMFRAGLRLLLSQDLPSIQFYETSSIEAAIELTDINVDVALLDIHLKGLNGLEGIALLRRQWPQIAVLMLSSQDDSEVVNQALLMGAVGFVSKAETPENIVCALKKILPGRLIATTSGSRLTNRQHEVLELLNKGLVNKLIAHQLSLSENTVRRHVQDILRFFDATNRSEAVFTARHRGLIK